LAATLDSDKILVFAIFHGGCAMTRRCNLRRIWLAAILLPLVAVLSVAAVGTVRADDSQSPASAGTVQQAPASPPSNNSLPAQPPPAFKPGFLHQLGVWWDQGIGDFNAKMKSAKDKLDDIKTDQSTKDATAATQDALKNAADAVVHLPTTRMFEIHERCQTAVNGAPDCPAAANNACRGKGFTTGKPMGISTSQVCPPAVLASGRPPAEGECRDETVILGVVCQ
jgi:hypothetical protein